MKINFCNLGKKAILKKTQLIHFLKKGRAPVSLVFMKLNGLDQEASDSDSDTV
jgi:hypothetical protein